MRHKILALFLLACCVAVGLSLGRGLSFDTARPAAAQADALEGEFKADLARISALRDARDLSGLIKWADEVEQKWGQLDASRYAQLMLAVCRATMSTDYKDDRQYYVGRKYVALALRRADEIPVETEVELVLNLGGDAEQLRARTEETERGNARGRRMQLWFHAWRRLEAELDKNFDPKARPALKATPPRGTTLPAGVAPEPIADPQLRAEYTAAVAAHASKSRAYTRQFQLHQLQEMFSKEAERYVVEMYSTRPLDSAELNRRLDESLASQEVKQKILDAVTTRINAPTAPEEP